MLGRYSFGGLGVFDLSKVGGMTDEELDIVQAGIDPRTGKDAPGMYTPEQIAAVSKEFQSRRQAGVEYSRGVNIDGVTVQTPTKKKFWNALINADPKNLIWVIPLAFATAGLAIYIGSRMKGK